MSQADPTQPVQRGEAASAVTAEEGGHLTKPERLCVTHCTCLKKSGAIHLCVDYCRLNTKTRKDAFPLLRIEESLDALGGAWYFSAIDLASAYNQVEVHPSDRHKTAFATPVGLFEYNRMPTGLCNAPAMFQKLMQTIFHEELLQILLVYLDDIIVYSCSIADHLSKCFKS